MTRSLPFPPRPAAPAVPLVHVVTSDEIVARPDFIDVACAVMRVLGARGAVHLRAPRAHSARLHELGEALAVAQRLTSAWLVVNDRVDVALTVGARGAQLTSRSLHVDDARRTAPALAVGASVHSVAEGQAATRAGASWLVASQVFATSSIGGHPDGMAFIEALAAASPIPVIAIGGCFRGTAERCVLPACMASR